MGQVEYQQVDVYQPPKNLPEQADVDHSPLGGKVGMSEEARAAMEHASTQVDPIMGDHIGATYAENPVDGHVLNHIRRRNLGLI